MKLDNRNVTRKYDRRIKLTDEQRLDIKNLYGSISQRKLAKMYGVSRRLITFIGDESKHEENMMRRAERGGSKIYYDKKKWRGVMREHRSYKRQLNEQGLI